MRLYGVLTRLSENMALTDVSWPSSPTTKIASCVVGLLPDTFMRAPTDINHGSPKS